MSTHFFWLQWERLDILWCDGIHLQLKFQCKQHGLKRTHIKQLHSVRLMKKNSRLFEILFHDSNYCIQMQPQWNNFIKIQAILIYFFSLSPSLTLFISFFALALFLSLFLSVFNSQPRHFPVEFKYTKIENIHCYCMLLKEWRRKIKCRKLTLIMIWYAFEQQYHSWCHS